MKKLISYLSATTLAISCAGMAWATPKIEGTVSIAPESKLTNQEQDAVRLAACRLLLHVDQARQDLKKDDLGAAQKNVGQSLLLGKIITSVMPTYKIKCDVKSSAAEYVDESELKPLLVTLREDLGEIAVLEPIRKAKRNLRHTTARTHDELTDIELAEARAQLDVNMAINQLKAAKAALDSKNAKLADQALADVQTGVDFQCAITDLPVDQPEAAKGAESKTSRRLHTHKSASKSKISGSHSSASGTQGPSR